MSDQPTSSKSEPHVDLDRFIHHTALPHTRLSDAVDKLLRRIGDFASGTWIILLAVIVINVILRYIFGEGRIEFEEIQWHLYSIGFLIGLSYTFEADDHVRVDVLHNRCSLRTQAWIELYGILLLLMPFLILILIYSVPFIVDAFITNERSQAPGGLPYRWIIKAFLFIGFALLSLAAVSRLTRLCSLLFGAPKAMSPGTE